MQAETIKVGKRGTIVIPASMRARYGFTEGSQIMVQATDQGMILLPAVSLPVEMYGLDRRAEFLLNNAVSDEEYQMAKAEVQAMGLDPDDIPQRDREEP